ncbi:MAG: TetR/AcrR family transcriptional regulator [Mycobacteriales bacterium]
MAQRKGKPTPSSDGRRERWRAHREARRQELVAAVIQVVRRRGADVGMDDLAEQSGTAKPVFYRYFADKEDLRLAVGRSVASGLVEQLTKEIAAAADPRAMLAAGIDCYLRVIEADPELYRFVLRSALPSIGGEDPVADYSTVLGLHVTRLLGEQLRAVGADAGAAEPWGFALVGSVRSAADRWLAQPTMTRSALCAYLTDFAWHGISAITALQEGPSVVRPLRRGSEASGAG